MQRTSKPAGGVGRLAVILVIVLLAAAGPAAAQHGAPANGEWPTYGGDLGSTKYSPLDQIDRDNFGDLEIAWRWRSADAVLSLTMPDGSGWRADSRLIFAEAEPPRSGAVARRPAPHHHELQGHPADGRRPALHQHADVGGRRHRRADGRDAVGPQPQELRGRDHHDVSPLEPARRGVLVERPGPHRRADLLRHRQRLSRLRRREDRAAVRRLRGRRPAGPDGRHPARHARRSRLAERAALLRPVPRPSCSATRS